VGESWLDDALDPQTRSLLTIGLVAALGQVGEVRLHTAGRCATAARRSRSARCSKHVAVYTGVALAVAALNVADEEIAAMAAADGAR